MQRRNIPTMLLGAASVVLLATSVVGYLDRDTRGTGSSSGTNTVRIADFTFEPDTIQVSVGTTVSWTNDDDFAHTVTSKTDGRLESGDIGPGGTYRATFDAPGSSEYVCTIHPSMSGVVEVMVG